MKYDFVAIGDITTDAFIKLKDAEELVNHGTRELCVRFADKVPFEEVIEALEKIKFSGVCSIEFEKDMTDPLPGIAESIGFFRGVMMS